MVPSPSRLAPRLLTAVGTICFPLFAAFSACPILAWTTFVIGVLAILGSLAWEEWREKQIRASEQVSKFNRSLLQNLGARPAETDLLDAEKALSIYRVVFKKHIHDVRSQVLPLIESLWTKVGERPYPAEVWPVYVGEEIVHHADARLRDLVAALRDASPSPAER